MWPFRRTRKHRHEWVPWRITGAGYTLLRCETCGEVTF